MLLTEDSDNNVAQTSNPNNSEWCVESHPPFVPAVYMLVVIVF